MEAYNLRKSGAKTIKELIVDLSSSNRSQYIYFQPGFGSHITDYYDVNGLNIGASQYLPVGKGTFYHYVYLGSFFNNVKSCEIEITLGQSNVSRSNNNNGCAASVYLWGSSLLANISATGHGTYAAFSGKYSINTKPSMFFYCTTYASSTDYYSASFLLRITSLIIRNIQF